jgi:hypothetical protein
VPAGTSYRSIGTSSGLSHTGADLEDVRREIARRLGPLDRLRILSSGELVEYFAAEVRRAFATAPAGARVVPLRE